MSRGLENAMAKSAASRQTSQNTQMQRVVEQVQILTGERGDKRKRALLVQDFVGVPALKQMTSNQVVGEPTLSDYNKLQADIATIHSMLSAVLKATGGKS